MWLEHWALKGERSTMKLERFAGPSLVTYSNKVRLGEGASVMESCDLSCVFLFLWLLCGEQVGRWKAAKRLRWSYRSAMIKV